MNWSFCSIIINRKHLPYSLSFWRRRKSHSLQKIPGPILWWNNAHVPQRRTSLHLPIYCRTACGLHCCWIDWDSVVPHYILKIGTCPYRLVVDMVSWRSIFLQSDFHFLFNIPGSNLCVSFPWSSRYTLALRSQRQAPLILPRGTRFCFLEVP